MAKKKNVSKKWGEVVKNTLILLVTIMFLDALSKTGDMFFKLPTLALWGLGIATWIFFVMEDFLEACGAR